MTNSGFQNNWLRTDGKADLRFRRGDDAGVPGGRDRRRDSEQPHARSCCGSEARRLLRFNRYFPRLTNWLIARKVKKLYVEYPAE